MYKSRPDYFVDKLQCITCDANPFEHSKLIAQHESRMTSNKKALFKASYEKLVIKFR